MYGCESWTIKKAEHWIDAFELWFWRRFLRVPWTAKRSNQSILKEINPEYSLEGLYWSWKWKWSRSVVFGSLRPHELGPTRILHPWDFPGKSIGAGCHFLLQGIFLTQGLNSGLPHCRQTLYHLSPQGSPKRTEAEAPIIWPPDSKSRLIWKGPGEGKGKNWRQKEKGVTEDEMVGWHQRLNGHEFE